MERARTTTAECDKRDYDKRLRRDPWKAAY